MVSSNEKHVHISFVLHSSHTSCIDRILVGRRIDVGALVMVNCMLYFFFVHSSSHSHRYIEIIIPMANEEENNKIISYNVLYRKHFVCMCVVFSAISLRILLLYILFVLLKDINDHAQYNDIV